MSDELRSEMTISVKIRVRVEDEVAVTALLHQMPAGMKAQEAIIKTELDRRFDLTNGAPGLLFDMELQ